MSNKIKIIAIGELLWDCFPEGRKLGGAPANVAFHCSQYGADAALISAVGGDEPGETARRMLAERGLDVDFIQRADYPTGMVKVTVDSHGKPTYCIEENAAWDNIRYDLAMVSLMANADGICFGSLAQRGSVSRDTILRLLEHCRPGCLKVFDINLRQHYYSVETIRRSLELADVFKLNDEELPLLGGMFGLVGGEVEMVRQLAAMFSLKTVALTRGKQGSVIIAGDDISDCPCYPEDRIVDTVGAGDSFTATLIVGLIRGLGIDEINRRASRTAAYVCSRSGAMPELPKEITG